MSADALISLLAEGSFVLLAVITFLRMVLRPRRVKVHTAAFFGMVGVIVLVSWASALGWIEESRPLSILTVSLLLALPYPLLGLADDFTGVPAPIKRATEAALAASLVGVAALGEELPGWFVIVVVAYFVGTVTYASWQFTRAAATMRSVSRLRMSLAALGSLALGGVLLLAGVQAFVESSVLGAIGNLFAATAGLSYYVGFAMPAWLKRSVHASQLQRFLSRSLSAAPEIYRTGAGLEAIEAAVADAMGTPDGRIVLWDEGSDEMRVPTMGDIGPAPSNPRSTVVYRVFETQEPYFTEDAGAEDPDNADQYTGEWAKLVLLAAPITLDDRRFGVLTAFGGLPPFIHDDDLGLLQVMAAQVAVILRNAELLGELTQAQSREEAARLMTEFFAAVAHDLKTPLTTILGQGQRIQRQMKRTQPVDPQAVDHIVAQALHMRRLVEDILDDTRDRAQYTSEHVATDLLQIAEEVARLAPVGLHQITVDGDRAVVFADQERIRQVLTNLVENAVKYSPDGGPISIRVGDKGDCATLTVTDQGIGIPPGDLETIFERFSRGSREPDRRFSGLGLGLYTCRRIVLEHGGEIEVTSRLGAGSTFTVHLPAGAPVGSGKVQDVQAGTGD